MWQESGGHNGTYLTISRWETMRLIVWRRIPQRDINAPRETTTGVTLMRRQCFQKSVTRGFRVRQRGFTHSEISERLLNFVYVTSMSCQGRHHNVTSSFHGMRHLQKWICDKLVLKVRHLQVKSRAISDLQEAPFRTSRCDFRVRHYFSENPSKLIKRR